MALTTCKECGQQVSTKAGTCPGCGAPISSGSGFLGNVIVLAILAGVVWYYAPTGSIQKLKDLVHKTADSESAASNSAATPSPHLSDPAFPAGNYKYSTDTVIKLKPDKTFTVQSNQNPLWNCEGTWSFDGETLSMRSDPDEGTKHSIPEMFYSPAKLISKGNAGVMWECNFKQNSWKWVDP